MIALFRGPWLALAAVALVSLLLAGGARAQQAEPHVTVRASAETVEVGEPFTVELKAMVERGAATPSDPQLRAPREFTVSGPSESTQTIINGFGARASVKVGIGATWQLVAQRPGHYVIPAPSIQWGSKRLSPRTPVIVDVTPATGRPRRQPTNPFLMPGGPGFNFPWPFHDDVEDDEAHDPRAVPALAMPSAPDPAVFVRAIADKKSAVIGEQVTLSFYIYLRYETQIAAWHEAPLSDFVRQPLLKNPGTEQPVAAIVGGKRWTAKLFDKVAIFPVKAGDLHTGSLRITFGGSRGGRYGDRATEDLVIHVTEPPRAGRPPGYSVGDVGQFGLSASVQPRRVDLGGSVAVMLKVTGAGNLPDKLHLPERTGIEWLDPEKKEAIEPQNGLITGWRTFGYVVRIKESGRVDLGVVDLPYWDPVARKYVVAKAPLGTVEVIPGSPVIDPVTKQAVGAVPPEAKPFAGLPDARATLGAYTPPRGRLFDGGALWLLIGAPPVFVGALSAGAGALRRARERRASSKGSPAALAQKALRDAAEAEKLGDTKAIAAALERAVHLAVEGAVELKSRGVLLADLPAELERRGLTGATAEAISGALTDLETIRFDPKAAARDISARVRALVSELGRHRAS